VPKAISSGSLGNPHGESRSPSGRAPDLDLPLQGLDGSGDLDSDEEVATALAGGAATDIGVIKSFECPVIPLPQSG
jgi:hypothetical protein